MKEFITNEYHLKRFFQTMYERQLIWYKRFVLNLPREHWTDDKYYSKYRFTNVYRELDRTSQFLLKNIILNKNCWHKYTNDDDNYINLIWKILFFRILNNPNLFTDVNVISDFNNYDADVFYKYLQDNILANKIAFAHGAFCQCSKHKIEINNQIINFENMAEYFSKFILYKLHMHINDVYQYMKDSYTGNKTAYDFIKYMSKTLDGCGKFTAHELFQDLCYIKEYTGIELMAYDANSATNAGPGSTAGSKYIFSNITSTADVIDAIIYLQSIAKEQLDKINAEYYNDDGFYYVKWDINKNKYEHCNFNLTLNQIEMWLCEYCKYCKYEEGENKVRVRLYAENKPTDILMY